MSSTLGLASSLALALRFQSSIFTCDKLDELTVLKPE
jgi:hypothetical protein